MASAVCRRELLKRLGAAGTGVAVAPLIARGQQSPIIVAGRPVEIVVAAVSPATVRITALPLERAAAPALGNTGSLVAAAAGRVLGRQQRAFAPIRAGELVVRFTDDPPTLHVDTAAGDAIQRLVLDPQTKATSFALGKGPLLGFGEGGPQFDRKGATYTNRN